MLKNTLPEAERLRVAVVPFEDQRADTGRIGTRRDWLGSEAALTVGGNHLGEMIAEVLVEYLKHRRGWQTWLAKPGVVPPEGGPDITISGTVVVFGAEVVSGLGGTDLTVTAQIRMKAQYAVDQRSIVETLDDTETRWVFSCKLRDIETFINSVLRKNAERFLSMVEVAMDGRRLRPK